MKFYVIALLLMASPMALFAQSVNSDTLVRALSACDSRFFAAMRKHMPELMPFGPVVRKGDVAYWKVPDRTQEAKSVLKFKRPMEGAVRLVAYFDEILELDPPDRYYSWGVLARGTPESVVNAIESLIEDADRLLEEDDAYTRSEVRDITDDEGEWIQNDDPADSPVDAEHAVERVFTIESAGEAHPGLARIGCSLQGPITPQLLVTERPDIGE